MTGVASSGDDREAPPARQTEPRVTVDLYETLQVSPNANVQVIRAAYRVLARDYHPDANVEHVSVESQRRIRELNAAYYILNDPERRAEYDLERLRTRRHERVLRSDRAPGMPTMVEIARARRLPDRLVTEVHTDEHFSLRGGTVVVLMLVVVLTMLMVLLLWSALDTGRDDLAGAYTLPAVQISQH